MCKKLSIIIPVYNDVRVERAIRSVLNYKNDDLELIVIDGASTDGTKEAIQKMHEYVDVFVSEKDRSVTEAGNKGIRLASGEWIFSLAADDILICDPLKVIDKYGGDGVDVICGNIISENKNGYSYNYSSPDLTLLDRGCSVKHPASFFRKKVYSLYGLYDETLCCAADRDMYLKLRNNGAGFKFISEFIIIFSYGGLSTKNPLKYAYKEDRIISIKYGANKNIATINYVFRCLRFFWWKFKGKIADLLKIKRKTQSISRKEIEQTIKKQNQKLM